MDEVLGRIDDIYAEPGMKPRFRIPVNVTSKIDSPLDIVQLSCKLQISYSERGGWTVGQYIGEAFPDGPLRMLSPGDSNSLHFLAPMDFEVLDLVENERKNRDVVLQIVVNFSSLSRIKDMASHARVVAGDIRDFRNQSNSFLSVQIPKSKWEELLEQLGYSIGAREPIRELTKTIQEARHAKQEAEIAAKAAKEAAQLTAVTSLAQAYDDEAKTLNKRCWAWLAISFIFAGLGGWLMLIYVRESFGKSFSLPEAIIRAVVIAAIFGAFTLSLRVYEAYRHLEVVNRHRVNIGRTFEAFKAAQPTERAREIMAAITAEHMLSFGKSGFAGKDTPNQGPFWGATEMIKAIVDKSSNP